MEFRNRKQVIEQFRAMLLILLCAGSVAAFNLSVRVVDCNGKSTTMGGVRVKIFRVYGDGSTELDRNLKTDASGNLNMQGFSQGTYEIQVFCPKGTAAIRHEFYPGPFVGSAHYVFKCCPTGTSGIVSGTFYYDSGQVETTIYDEKGNKVRVSMTDDQYAGGTFSGTVVTEAAGNTPDERAANEAEFSGNVVNVATSTAPAKSGAMTWTIPAELAAKALEIVLRDRSGNPIGKVEIPHQSRPNVRNPSSPSGQPAFKLPTIGQAGGTLKAEGSFDGKFDNTTITIGGREVEKIAESPHRIIFKPLTSPSGLSEIVLREGKHEARAPYRNVTAKLSAPTTTINTGQNLNVQAEFAGLEGITEDVMIIIQTLGPVKLKGGNFQTIKISPKQVHDGKCEITLPLTGERPGGFTVKTTVVTKGSERVVMSGLKKAPTESGSELRNILVSSVIPDRLALRSSLPVSEQLVKVPSGQPTRSFLYIEGENIPEHISVAVQPDSGVRKVQATRLDSRNVIVELVLAPETPIGKKQIVFFDQQTPSGQVVADRPVNLYRSLTPEEEKKLDGEILRNKWRKFKQFKNNNRRLSALWLMSLMRELNLLPPRITPPAGTDEVSWWDQVLFGAKTAGTAGAEAVTKTIIPIETIKAIEELAGLLADFYGDPNSQGGAHGLRKQLASRGLTEEEIGEINDQIAEVYNGLRQRAGK